jgi:UDP-glucose 4-epimerase
VAGNIGSFLSEYILNSFEKCKLIGLDNLSTGKIDNLLLFKDDSRFKFYLGDCNQYSDIEKVFVENKIDYVFHYAACVGVERTLLNPKLVFNDLDGIKYISELSRKFLVKKVAFSSSSEVYGEPKSLPLVAGVSPVNPSLPYAVVKCLGEIFFETFHHESLTKFLNFRFFNTYGPSQSLDYVLPRFINNALNNQDIEIFGDGKQTRTFLYVCDNAEATVKMMFNDDYHSSTVNIGSQVMIEIKELAHIVKEIVGSNSRIVFSPGRERGDARVRQPENSEFINVLGRQPTDLYQGIVQLISMRT